MDKLATVTVLVCALSPWRPVQMIPFAQNGASGLSENVSEVSYVRQSVETSTASEELPTMDVMLSQDVMFSDAGRTDERVDIERTEAHAVEADETHISLAGDEIGHKLSYITSAMKGRDKSRAKPLMEPHKFRVEASHPGNLAENGRTIDTVNTNPYQEDVENTFVFDASSKENEHENDYLFPKAETTTPITASRSLFSIIGRNKADNRPSSNSLTESSQYNTQNNSSNVRSALYLHQTTPKDEYRTVTLEESSTPAKWTAGSSDVINDPAPEQLFSLLQLARDVSLADIASDSGGSLGSSLAHLGRLLLRLQLPLDWLPLVPDILLGVRQRYDTLLAQLTATTWLSALTKLPSELKVQSSRQLDRHRSPRAAPLLRAMLQSARAQRHPSPNLHRELHQQPHQLTDSPPAADDSEVPVGTSDSSSGSICPQGRDLQQPGAWNSTAVIRSLLTSARVFYRLARVSHRSLGSLYSWYSAVCAASNSAQKQLQLASSLSNLQLCAAWLMAPEEGALSQFSSWLHCGCALVAPEQGDNMLDEARTAHDIW